MVRLEEWLGVMDRVLGRVKGETGLLQGVGPVCRVGPRECWVLG